MNKFAKELVAIRDDFRQARSNIYDAVKRLAALYEDATFLKYMRKSGKTVIDKLDEIVADQPAHWSELYQVFRMFPNKLDWTRGRVIDLVNKYRRATTDKKKSKKLHKRRATVSELDKLQGDNKRLIEENEHLRREVKSLQDALEMLKSKPNLRIKKA